MEFGRKGDAQPVMKNDRADGHGHDHDHQKSSEPLALPQREHQLAAVDLDLAEGVVLLGLARRQGRLAEADAVGGELEAVAVEVVAVGHLEADFDLLVAREARAGAEGLLGRQRLVGGVGAQGQQAEQRGKQEGDKAGEAGGRRHGRQCRGKGGGRRPLGSRNGDQACGGVVSAATQAR